jgi:hypothetical protein
MDAADLVLNQLPDILAVLQRHEDLFVAVSHAGHEVTWK